MWLECIFLKYNGTWETRYEFFEISTDEAVDCQMRKWLDRNSATYKGVLVRDFRIVICAIMS